MKVKLLTKTNNLVETIYSSARTCYNPGKPSDMFEHSNDLSLNSMQEFIKKIFRSGHQSPLEHANFTFAIEGISRACSHQLVRHRLCSFSQQSQRYVEYGTLEVTIPNKIKQNAEAMAIFEDCLNLIEHTYKTLTDIGIPAEDARAILPNATCTNIVMTVNLREMIHICNERLCNRAQGEIRTMVNKMRKEILAQEPWLEEFLVPKCSVFKYCPEHKGCGKMPTFDKLKEPAEQENKDDLRTTLHKIFD